MAAIRERIAKTGADTPEKRRLIYDQLGRLIDQRPVDAAARDALKVRLGHLVRKIEEELSMAQGPTAVGTGPRSTAQAPAPAPKSRSGTVVAGVVVAALVVAAVLFFGWSRLFPADPFALTIDNYKALPAAAAPIQPSDTRYVTGSVDGKPAITIVGQGSISTVEAFPVDPAKRYSLRVRLRVTESTSASVPVSVGVATFNEAGELETEAPGAHRYFLAVARPLSEAEGTVMLEGTITGSGNESYNTFRPGTRSVRPIVVANGASESDRVEVVEILFGEVVQK